MQYHFERLRRRILKLRDLDAVLKRRKFRGLRDEFYDRLWAEAAQDVGAKFEKTDGLTQIIAGSLCTYLHHSDLMLDDAITTRVMADKTMTYGLIAKLGHPVPDHCVFSLGEMEKARSFLARHAGGIVVKPARGTGGGNGVSVGIRSNEMLNQAARHASSFNSKLLAEPILEGASLRLLYLDGVFLDAVLRDRPTVIGDGSSTLRQLIKGETRNRLTRKPIVALNPLNMDVDCRSFLQRQKLDLGGRPGAGQRIAVKNVVNENAARDNRSVRDAVNPEIIEAGGQLVRNLNVSLAGLDVIVRDHTAPMQENGAYFHEVNIGPGLHHHYLIANRDEGVPVASRILDTMFRRKIGVIQT